MMSRHMVITFGAIILLATVISACTSSPAATLSSSITATSALATATQSDVPVQTTYNWRGTTLTLAAALPAGPSEAGVFRAQPETPATVESARALADQLEMSGEIYAGFSGLPGARGFLVVDGNRRLMVRANGDFSYYPDHSNYWTSTDHAHPADAEQQIADFMRAYGFGEEYNLHYSEIHGSYFALPLMPGGFPLRHNHFTPSGYFFSFNESGISSVTANLISYDPVRSFGLIPPAEALQKFLDPNLQVGKLEGFISPVGIYSAWVRTYPQEQTVTIFGYMNSTPSLEGGKPLVTLDGYTATGNLAGIAATMPETFVEATGQFLTEGGVDVFVLEAWSVYGGFGEGLLGTLVAKDDKVFLVTDQAELLMPDVPGDVPLPLESVYAMGVTRGDVFEWNAFDMRMANGGGGGGGGGGLGLYKLNLTGTPVPLPTQEVRQLPQVGQRFEGQRGVVTVTFYNQPDGSQRIEYTLYSTGANPYAMILQGEGLEVLQALHNRPVDIWGSISAYDEQFAQATLDVERFEIPFPDLQFQILRGTQQEILVDEKPAILFTTSDGQPYVQVIPGGYLDTSLIGVQGDEVLLEGLLIPGETIGGFATVRIFSGGVALNANGQAIDMQITADQPWVTDEPEAPDPDYVPPTASIDTVELVYFMQDPRLNAVAEDGAAEYIQPMWRFAGRWSTGEVFEILVQALQAEFLLPEIQAIVGPG